MLHLSTLQAFSESPSKLTQEGKHIFMLLFHFAYTFLIVLITLYLDLESFAYRSFPLVHKLPEDKDNIYSSPYLNNYTVLGTK